MSFLKLGEDLREQVSIFIESVKRIEGIEKTINLTAEKFLLISKDPLFESKLATFYLTNFADSEILKPNAPPSPQGEGSSSPPEAPSGNVYSKQLNIENFWRVSLEIVQSRDVYPLLEYVPLFDNLLFESFINRHYNGKLENKKNYFGSKNDLEDVKNSKDDWDQKGRKDAPNELRDPFSDPMQNDSGNSFGKVDSDEESEMDFGGADFGLYGFDENSRHMRSKRRSKKPEIKRLALRFLDCHEGINYLEVEKYLEAIVNLLREVRFDEFPELVSVGDFSLWKEGEARKEESHAPDTEERSCDYREVNRQRMGQVDFLIKDDLNDLMENASLTNILMDLNEIQDKFISQDKTKLNFLNMLIYSVDFSELMSLLFEYAIKLLKEEIEEEEHSPASKDESMNSQESNKTDILVFLVMKLQFKILFGLAELRLFELFHRELNLKFEDIKILKMEKLRTDIREQLAMYFSKPVDENFSTALMSQRAKIQDKSRKNKIIRNLDKLEELYNFEENNQESIIMLDKTQSEIEYMHQDLEGQGQEEDENIDEDLEVEEVQIKSECIGSPQEEEENFGGDQLIQEDPVSIDNENSDEIHKVNGPKKVQSRSLSNGEFNSQKEANLTFQQLQRVKTNTSSKDRSQSLEKNFSFKNDLSTTFANKFGDNHESIRRARENLDELISIRQIINETNTNFSISETSDQTLLNMLNIPFGVKNIVKSQIKSGHGEGGIKAHIKSKSNHWKAEVKRLKEQEPDFREMFKVDSKGKFNLGYLSDFKRQISLIKPPDVDSKISSIMFDKQLNQSKSFFSQDKNSRDGEDEKDSDELELGQKNLSREDNSNKSESIIRSNDPGSENKTVPLTRHSIPKSENEQNRATSKRDILPPIQKLHEERPTHKYRGVEVPKNPVRVSIDPETQITPPVEHIKIEYSYVCNEDVIKYFLENHKSDEITFNKIRVFWTNFKDLFAGLSKAFPDAQIKVEGEKQKKKLETHLRKYRSKVEGLRCNVMKVQRKYIAFFDPKFYSIVKDICDVDYMRKQINLLMINGKYELLATKNKVQDVRFTKPIYMNQLKLNQHPIFW